jgi:hypothetical protein
VRPHFPFKLLLLLFAVCASGQPPAKQATQTSPQFPAASQTPVLTLPTIGRGIQTIGGDWQFHLGDDMSWARPSADDSQWETIKTDDTWGAQGHPGYAGFAWYRRHIQVATTAADANRSYRIAIMEANDAYEVYWNGKLIGQYGRLPPHALWYYAKSGFASSFPLTGAPAGVLAIRVWKAPLDVYDTDELGGIYLPQIGDPTTITLRQQASEWRMISSDLFDYGLIMLRVFIAFLCLVLWFRNRDEHLFVWVAIYTAAPVVLDILNRLFRIPFPWNVARALNQPIYVLFHVSMWFLLIWLLRLHQNAALVRVTKLLGYVSLAAGVADGILAFFWAYATAWMQWANGILNASLVLAEFFPFVVIAMGLRQKLDASRWTVALSALLLTLINSALAATSLGQRFTHWTFSNFLNDPLFRIQGVYFFPSKVASLVVFGAILYAVYRYALEQQARHGVMEHELQSGREIQQVLVPEALPAIEGYAVSSAYQPAMEVGGDFFQIIPNDDGSTIVALGDVSGKGLKAGMNVAMIVGVLRADAGKTSPAEMLASLNRCLVGRMAGGFATGMIFRVDPDGTVTFANAGHLPPYLNGQEYQLDASLPLGLIGYSDYTEQTLILQPGDQLSVYTDGLLEATSPAGELFGFDRMNALFAARPSAQQAMKAAIDFGQEDDITVLTITRLALGVQPSTSLSAPDLTLNPSEA